MRAAATRCAAGRRYAVRAAIPGPTSTTKFRDNSRTIATVSAPWHLPDTHLSYAPPTVRFRDGGCPFKKAWKRTSPRSQAMSSSDIING